MSECGRRERLLGKVRFGPSLTVPICLLGTALRGAELHAVAVGLDRSGTDSVSIFRVDQTMLRLPPERTLGSNPDFVILDLERSVLVAGFPYLAPTHFAIVNIQFPSTVREIDLKYNAADVLPYSIFEVDTPGKVLYLGLALGRLWAAVPQSADEITRIALTTPRSAFESLPTR